MAKQFNYEKLAPCRDCACFNIRKATRVLTQHFDDAMQSSGLRGTQFTILAMVAGMQAVTVSELAEQLVMDRTTLTRNLRPLENQNLLQSMPGADRRTRTITLTQQGYDVLELALPLWKNAQKKIVAYLGKTRFKHLLGDLRYIEKIGLTKST